jgi:N-acetylmuramoyl-L-alanine amidase
MTGSMYSVLFMMLAFVPAPWASGAVATTQPTAREMAPRQAQITVRNGDKARTVPLVRHPEGGAAVRVDLLAEALGGQLVAAAPLRYRLQLGAFALTLAAGSSLGITAEDTVPLTASAYRVSGRLYAPLSLVSELLPRLAGGLIFDSERNELRRFAIITASRRQDNRTAGANRPAAAAAPPRGTVTEPAARPSRRRVVVVDAGHGGVDPGMGAPLPGGGRLREKDVTLAVSRELRNALDRRGVTVVMTRTRDTLIALADRGRMANQAKGDVFLSIHVNAANPGWASPGATRGFETYFLAEAKTEDEKRVEAMENEAIRFETTVDASRHDPLGFIIRDMAQNEHLRESSRLAELIQGGMKAVHPGPSRGVKQAGFRVLVSAFMPAVLIEIGFGTNAADAGYMTSPVKQRELAESIADATIAYLAEYDRKVSGQ